MPMCLLKTNRIGSGRPRVKTGGSEENGEVDHVQGTCNSAARSELKNAGGRVELDRTDGPEAVVVLVEGN